MSDIELIKMAAKAAGIDHPGGEHSIANDGRLWDCQALRWWNPLTDDGDALRLAVRLGISVSFSHSTSLDVAYPTLAEVGAFAGWCPTFTEIDHGDWTKAARRAITRAAAGIGKATP